MKKFSVLVFHPGIQHSPRLVKVLNDNICNTYFLTSCIFYPKSIVFKILSLCKFPIFKSLSNRIFPELDFKKIKCYYSCELFYLIDRNIYKKNLFFQRRIQSDKWIKSTILIGFDTSSYHILDRVKQPNQYFILDQTTPHYNLNIQLNKLLNLEANEKSELELSNEKMEHGLADLIVVASTFAKKKSLVDNGIDCNKITVIPYGVDLKKCPYKKRTFSNKLIFVYVGNVNKRKGIELLIKSWSSCKAGNKELWIIGPFEETLYTKDYADIRFFGKVEHQELINILHQANVFIFPSYFDGFGLVLLEAMASGLPIIASSNCGAPDLIENGVEGFIFEAGNENELTSKINYFLEKPTISLTMGIKARNTAEKFTWDEYGKKWFKLLTTISANTCL